jgi:subtilisin family serine protease
VAILDTGCGAHPWLDGIVDTSVTLDGTPIGDTGRANDPEVGGDHSGPFDGSLDPLSGHGTFICGVVHQVCPDADIVAWRVVSSSGTIVESDWVDALVKIAELARRHAAGEPGGHPIDVLNLSMGYYHETPQDALFDPTLRGILDLLGECGVAVVCSVGNDATAREFYPAAFAPRSGDDQPRGPERVPVVSVGALNPDCDSVALFSTTGAWFRCYAPGGKVLTTMPAFQGGLEPVARTTAHGLVRESIDPDDFTGGFGVWSGTSFAAPFVAGRLAGALAGSLPPQGQPDPAGQRVARARGAVRKVTGIGP